MPLPRNHVTGLCPHSSLLEHIWIATVDALGKSVSTLPKKPNQRYLYQRLHDALLFLNGFFNAGGEGLTGEHLDSSQYKVRIYHDRPPFIVLHNPQSTIT